MKEGDVVIIAMPQADGGVKNRPVIFLREMPPFQDALVCGVSSQLRHEVKGFDEIVSPNDDDFEASGLVGASLIRLGFLTVIAHNKIIGSIGSIFPDRHRQLLERLSNHLISYREDNT
ncbi:MAG: transcriptional regulator [Chloracidobacterium sp.]|nr:transcriptional regulator [Chloracidobacterium sp.]